MIVNVEGGTHLGVIGCYGEQSFEVNNLEEVHDKIKNDESLKHHNLHKYKKIIIDDTYTFVDSNNKTIFEYRILECFK